MKDTLVILGNGFDLDLGWKTSYRDIFTHQIMKNALFHFGGSAYANNLVDGEYWCDFEGYLRKCVEEVKESRIRELNHFWILCRNNMFSFFKDQSTQSFIYQTKKDSCALHFLKHVSDNSVFSFNYTNPFKQLGFANVPIEFIHGQLENAFNGSEIKVGVDSGVSNPLVHDPSIEPLVKSTGSDTKYRLFHAIKSAKNIIIYGHSLGITDSDYFKPVFEAMINGSLKQKSLYIVTKDEKGLSGIEKNVTKYGIKGDQLLFSSNDFHFVYTIDGAETETFKEMVGKL